MTASTWRALGAFAACVAIALGVSQSTAQQPPGEGQASRLVTIDHPGGEQPNVEVSLTAAMFRDLAGLGDAALAGVAQGLMPSGDVDHPARKIAGEQIARVRDVVKMLEGTIEEVHVNVYAGPRTEAIASTGVADHYSKKLVADGWDRLVRVNGPHETVVVFARREEGALRGVFVVAGHGNELVIANAACDVSPQRLQRVTEQLTKVWLEMGGDRELERAVSRLHRGEK